MPRRILEGVVVSSRADKTVRVRVNRTYLHPLLKKAVRRSRTYSVHDESNAFSDGQRIRIRECPPRSKTKRWEVYVSPEGSGS